jgi:hypothetical protein
MKAPSKKIRALNKKTMLPYELEHGLHYVLVNKKTGRVASKSNWLTAMAAAALLNEDNSGVLSLLPQAEAKKLLAKNDLDIRLQRGAETNKKKTELARAHAKTIIPILAVLWQKEKPSHRPPRRGDFCRWIVKCRQDEDNRNNIFNYIDFYPIPSGASWRWWLAQLGKMQS